MKPNKKQVDFHNDAIGILREAGFSSHPDTDQYQDVFSFTTKLGEWKFTLFKSTFNSKLELYSIYGRAPYDIPKDLLESINKRTYGGINPYSFKWNIHGNTSADALSTLKDYIAIVKE